MVGTETAEVANSGLLLPGADMWDPHPQGGGGEQPDSERAFSRPHPNRPCYAHALPSHWNTHRVVACVHQRA